MFTPDFFYYKHFNQSFNTPSSSSPDVQVHLVNLLGYLSLLYSVLGYKFN
jgi:hypothetical protein